MYPTSKSQDIGVDTPALIYALSIFQENEHREKFSRHCGNVVAHHPAERDTLHPKTNCWWKGQCYSAALIRRQHLWLLLQGKMTHQSPGLIGSFLTDLDPGQTASHWHPWWITCSFFCYVRIFSGSVYTVVSIDSTIKFKSGFIRPNNEIRKILSFITHVQ